MKLIVSLRFSCMKRTKTKQEIGVSEDVAIFYIRHVGHCGQNGDWRSAVRQTIWFW